MKEAIGSRARQILEILKGEFLIPNLEDIKDEPFKILIRTIISQSTAETNTERAYTNLSNSHLVEPEVLIAADIKKIEKALRVAGLYRNKAWVLKEVSKLIIEKFDGSLNFIHEAPLNEARENLMSLPGVGPKTSDIVLLFSGRRPVIPVDTHVNRVSKRLGLSPSKASYEGVRHSLENLYKREGDEYFAVHMLIIELGRKVCRARNPLCHICSLQLLCPSAKL